MQRRAKNWQQSKHEFLYSLICNISTGSQLPNNDYFINIVAIRGFSFQIPL